MKRVIIAALMLCTAAGLKAQSCEEIVLSYFRGDSVALANYPAHKVDFRCRYARNAMYFANAVPEGAVMKSLSDVTNRFTGEALTSADLSNGTIPNYYTFTFLELQQTFPRGNVTICFATQNPQQPYLVLRSQYEIYARTENPDEYDQ